MSDSNEHSPAIGFSTGALERGNYKAALSWLHKNNIDRVEISALRFCELRPLINDLDELSVEHFKYVSFHAPSSFDPEQEDEVVELLDPVFKRGWNIVVHPDVIRKPSLWRHFGEQLLIENMDRRKKIGRTADEMDHVFSRLPKARMCLDVAHARQLDTTLTLLSELLARFSERIAEVHISELDSRCKHVPMSWRAVEDYRMLPWREWEKHVPVIIESMLEGETTKLKKDEFSRACKASEANNEWFSPSSR